MTIPQQVKTSLAGSPSDGKTHPRPGHARARRRELTLTFSAAAWIKLQYLCHIGDTEIGAFAISSDRDPLYVEDIVMIDQVCSSISVEFNDEAVADFFDDQIDAGRRPEQFARIWVHTHPGASPEPSWTDIETFQRVFGRCDWAVMFILARGGGTFCQLRVSTPASGGDGQTSRLEVATELSVRVNYLSLAQTERSIDTAAWRIEHATSVEVGPMQVCGGSDTSDAPRSHAKESRNNETGPLWPSPVRGRGALDHNDEPLETLIDEWEQEDSEVAGMGGMGGDLT